ncbi:uncharacterized protein BXZ73DRAFT_110455 [Epithele typhae]|uniref:uncharacterized protein n=1 Tax=Epithele typhae TaxID=378194 RepID=UPI002008E398|nr:uncharacterized protein BXZ73DRAFT_110455 [Epithele typhae]KAH9906593.1 hypothetical protein BXZ73DRAFT_110455 [Epithele typhae]
MSTTRYDNPDQMIQQYAIVYTESYIILAAAVMIIFDYLLTFSREVEFFWKRRVSGATILFITNRYLLLLDQLLSLVQSRGFSDEVRLFVKWL